MNTYSLKYTSSYGYLVRDLREAQVRELELYTRQ